MRPWKAPSEQAAASCVDPIELHMRAARKDLETLAISCLSGIGRQRSGFLDAGKRKSM